MRRVARSALWVMDRRKAINRWVVRLVAFYFGYRILHHEVYEVEHVEPLVFFFGLWLIGIAPATFIEGLKKVGVQARSSLEDIAGTGGAEGPPKPELPSPDKPQQQADGA